MKKITRSKLFFKRRSRKSGQTRQLANRAKKSQSYYQEVVNSISFLQGSYSGRLGQFELQNAIPKFIR